MCALETVAGRQPWLHGVYPSQTIGRLGERSVCEHFLAHKTKQYPVAPPSTMPRRRRIFGLLVSECCVVSDPHRRSLPHPRHAAGPSDIISSFRLRRRSAHLSDRSGTSGRPLLRRRCSCRVTPRFGCRRPHSLTRCVPGPVSPNSPIHIVMPRLWQLSPPATHGKSTPKVLPQGTWYIRLDGGHDAEVKQVIRAAWKRYHSKPLWRVRGNNASSTPCCFGVSCLVLRYQSFDPRQLARCQGATSPHDTAHR